MNLETVRAGIVACERCPHLRSWCRQVAEQKTPEFGGLTRTRWYRSFREAREILGDQ
jgi:hypothetical protein